MNDGDEDRGHCAATVAAVTACRCGHPGDDSPHPCHGLNYTCRQPATQRFYGARLVALAGMQMKVEVRDTWACDACWEVRR